MVPRNAGRARYGDRVVRGLRHGATATCRTRSKVRAMVEAVLPQILFFPRIRITAGAHVGTPNARSFAR